MGNTESANQYQTQDLLTDFTQVRRQPHGVILSDKKQQNTYFLKQFNYVSKKQYESEFKRLQSVQSQPQNQNILCLVRLFSQTFNNICSNSYKIYALYEYPSITLEQEIVARKKQDKYFDESQLWSILQSCVNALSQLKPVLSLHPRNVFIVPDGVLKVINNQMIDQDYRCYIKQNVYYAPQKIRQFQKTDNQNTLRKQSIFSLGMTLLHAALLQPLNDCYNYQNNNFLEEKLEKHIQDLVNFKSTEESRRSQGSLSGKYSQEFIEMLAMILEPNPNKRASLMEVHGILNKVWNTQTQQGRQQQIQDPQHCDANQNASNTQKLQPQSVSKPKPVKTQKVRQNQKQIENINETSVLSQQQNLVKSKINGSMTQSGIHSFHQSQKQSKPNLNQISNVNMPKQAHTQKDVNVILPSQSNKNSVQYPSYPIYPTYVSNSSYSYNQTYNVGGLGAGFNKQNNNLYTDPKLLEMIRKDLQDLNQLKKSSMMSAYGGYPGTYLGSSQYYTGYNDFGAGSVYSSKSSLSGFPLTGNTQQIYTVNTQSVQTTQRIQTINPKIQMLKIQKQKQVLTQSKNQNQQQQPTFSKNNKKQVFVVEQYEDGRKFQGIMINGSKEGHGKLTYSDGAYYQGNFKNDRMEGKGTLFYGPNRPAYQGDWIADQFHGFGILYNQNPILLNGCFNYQDFNLIQDFWVKYQGNFDSDNKSGEGNLHLSNGEEFHGNFDNDLINGKGTFLTKDGDQINGLWEDNILVQLDA